MKSGKPTVISLFCGAGGDSVGFEKAGFKIIFANDIDKFSCNTFQKHFKNTEVICDDVNDVKLPDADVIVGGYPCQGFSLAGPRLVTDKRNLLYLEFARAIKDVKPKFFMAENVKGLLTLSGGKIVNAMMKEFSSLGYSVGYKLVSAKWYGVPQDRERVIIVGVRKDTGFNFVFPQPTHGPLTGRNYVNLRQAIGGLPEQNEEDIYDSGFSSRYMSRNRIRGWNHVSFTIPAMARQVPLHPSSDSMKKIEKDKWVFTGFNQRRLSWKECAIIQGFPKKFSFDGPLVEKYKQIGNAIPPLLAQKIANGIMKFFK